jgi:hypothetical protein
MKKSKLMKAILLGMCMALLSSNTAFASVLVDPNQAQVSASSEALDKQKEIDQYVLDHEQEIIDQGIHITHTAPIDNYVEIGILPYSDEKADYLYQLFGKDMVKVIEGVDYMTMSGAAPETGESSFPTIPVSIAGVMLTLIIIGGTVLIDRKRKVVKE